jgi:hypothetical protein
MKRRLLVLVAGLASAVALGAVAADAEGGQNPLDPARGALAMPGQAGPWGISLPSTKAGAPYTIGGIPVCLRSRRSATIDSIKTTGSRDDIRVTNFVVRPMSDELFGAEQVGLSESGVEGGHLVEAPCNGEPGAAELVVEMQKIHAANARVAGLSVTYSTAGHTGRLDIPLHLVLCQSANQDTPDCLALPQ